MRISGNDGFFAGVVTVIILVPAGFVACTKVAVARVLLLALPVFTLQAETAFCYVFLASQNVQTHNSVRIGNHVMPVAKTSGELNPSRETCFTCYVVACYTRTVDTEQLEHGNRLNSVCILLFPRLLGLRMVVFQLSGLYSTFENRSAAKVKKLLAKEEPQAQAGAEHTVSAGFANNASRGPF